MQCSTARNHRYLQMSLVVFAGTRGRGERQEVGRRCLAGRRLVFARMEPLMRLQTGDLHCSRIFFSLPPSPSFTTMGRRSTRASTTADTQQSVVRANAVLHNASNIRQRGAGTSRARGRGRGGNNQNTTPTAPVASMGAVRAGGRGTRTRGARGRGSAANGRGAGPTRSAPVLAQISAPGSGPATSSTPDSFTPQPPQLPSGDESEADMDLDGAENAVSLGSHIDQNFS